MISVKAYVKLNSYINLAEPFEIAGCRISTDGNMIISTTAEAEHLYAAKICAIEKIRKAIRLWTIATGESLEFDPRQVVVEGEFTMGMSVAAPFKPEMKREVERIAELLENADSYGNKCADYYERAIATRKWRSEAILNFFKACELIFDKIFSDASEEEITKKFKKPKTITNSKRMLIANEIHSKIMAGSTEEEILSSLDKLEGIPMRDKMLFMCEKLEISEAVTGKALSLPKVRSESAGHARLNEPTITEDVFNDFMLVAKSVLVRYLSQASMSPNKQT
jgi:hypothetical protein